MESKPLTEYLTVVIAHDYTKCIVQFESAPPTDNQHSLLPNKNKYLFTNLLVTFGSIVFFEMLFFSHARSSHNKENSFSVNRSKINNTANILTSSCQIIATDNN